MVKMFPNNRDKGHKRFGVSKQRKSMEHFTILHAILALTVPRSPSKNWNKNWNVEWFDDTRAPMGGRQATEKNSPL